MGRVGNYGCERSCVALQAVTSGANPIAVKKGIDKTCDFLIKKLREKAQNVQGTGDIKVSPQCSC